MERRKMERPNPFYWLHRHGSGSFWFVSPKTMQAAKKGHVPSNLGTAMLVIQLPLQTSKILVTVDPPHLLGSSPKTSLFPRTSLSCKSLLILGLKFYRLTLAFPFLLSGLRSQLDLGTGKHRLMTAWICCIRWDHEPWQPAVHPAAAGRDSDRAVHWAITRTWSRMSPCINLWVPVRWTR